MTNIVQTADKRAHEGRTCLGGQQGLRPEPTLAQISVDLPSKDATAEISNTRRNAIVRAAEQVGPAVVSISVTQVRIVTSSPFGRMFHDPLFEYFFPEMRREYRQNVKSMGSGFLIDDDGHVLTNWHVVQNASQIVVNLADGRQFQGELVGSDPALDLALLKIEGDDLPPDLVKINVLIPMTWPTLLIKGPPLLPELMAASVCIMFR